LLKAVACKRRHLVLVPARRGGKAQRAEVEIKSISWARTSMMIVQHLEIDHLAKRAIDQCDRLHAQSRK
jgi:hypothetical protein